MTTSVTTTVTGFLGIDWQAVGAIATGLLVIGAFLAWREIREDRRLAYRPYVVPFGFTLAAAGDRPDLKARLMNIGPGACLNVRFAAWVVPAAEAQDPFEIEVSVVEAYAQVKATSHHLRAEHAALAGAGADHWVQMIPTDAATQDWNAEPGCYVVFDMIEYEDLSGREHTTPPSASFVAHEEIGADEEVRT